MCNQGWKPLPTETWLSLQPSSVRCLYSHTLPPLGWRQERCSYFSLPLPNYRHTCSLRVQLSISHYQTTPSLILLLWSSTWHPQPHSLMVLPRGCDTLSSTVLIKMHNLRNQKIPWDKRKWKNNIPKLMGCKKKWNWVICSEVDGPRVCHTGWSKSEREKQILYANAYIWNLKKKLVLMNEKQVRNKDTDVENGLEDMGRGKGKLGWNERVALTYIHYQM